MVTERNWGTKIVLVLITIVLLALAGLLAVTWLPRWWAHRVGGVVDGAISTGVFAGLTCGVVFTAIPLLLLRRVFAWRGVAVASRVVWLILAAVFAAPNLTTLAIVLGNGNTAHAAERTLDVEAPAFRTSTAVGAVIGVAPGVALVVAARRAAPPQGQLEQLKARCGSARASSGARARGQARRPSRRGAHHARGAEGRRGTESGRPERPGAVGTFEREGEAASDDR